MHRSLSLDDSERILSQPASTIGHRASPAAAELARGGEAARSRSIAHRKKLSAGHVRSCSKSGGIADIGIRQLWADSVAKVVLHW